MSKKIKLSGIANILYGLILMSLLLLLFVMVGIGSWENSGIPGFILFTGLTVAVFGPTVGGYAFLMALTGAQLLMDKKNPKKLLRNLLICKFADPHNTATSFHVLGFTRLVGKGREKFLKLLKIR